MFHDMKEQGIVARRQAPSEIRVIAVLHRDAHGYLQEWRVGDVLNNSVGHLGRDHQRVEDKLTD